MNKKAFGMYLSFAAAVALIILTLVFPSQSANGVSRGLTLCGAIIIPSLFPFCVLALFCFKCGAISAISRMISPVTTKLLYLTGEQFCVFFMSFIAGYPIGMRLINELLASGKISVQQSRRMALYCVNAGPAFILSAVGGGILGNRRLGVVLLTVNIISTLLLELTVEFTHKPEITYVPDERYSSIGDAFVESTSQAASSMFGICAWIVFFSSIYSVTDSANLPLILKKITELTGEVTTAVCSANGNVPLIAAIISWCGFSVHCQIYSAGGNASPKYIIFVLARISHGALSFLLSHMILKADKTAVSTISNGINFSSAETSFSYAGSLVLILLCVVLIASTQNKKCKIV